LRWIEAKGFKRHEYPPQSPDLNRIEKAWAYLKSVVVHKAPKSEQTFYATMQKA
jgi:transposase